MRVPERLGRRGGSQREGVSTQLYQPGPIHVPRFFPGGAWWRGGNNKISEYLLCATHYPG